MELYDFVSNADLLILAAKVAFIPTCTIIVFLITFRGL